METGVGSCKLRDCIAWTRGSCKIIGYSNSKFPTRSAWELDSTCPFHSFHVLALSSFLNFDSNASGTSQTPSNYRSALVVFALSMFHSFLYLHTITTPSSIFTPIPFHFHPLYFILYLCYVNINHKYYNKVYFKTVHYY